MTKNDALGKNPAGVGGWLRLLILYLMVFMPLLSIVQLVYGFAATEKLNPRLLETDTWTHYKITIWALVLVVSGIAIPAGYCLWKDHRPRSVSIALGAIWIAGPISMLFAGVLAFLFFKQPFGEFLKNEILRTPFYIQIIKSCVLSAYLMWSKRVYNTYHRPPNNRADVF